MMSTPKPLHDTSADRSTKDPSSSYSTRLAAFTTTPVSTRREVLPRHTDFPTRPHLNSLIT